MKKAKTLTEEYYEVTEYIAVLEQILLHFAAELDVLPNAGMSDSMTEILDRLKGTIIDGQILRRDFEERLRKETKK